MSAMALAVRLAHCLGEFADGSGPGVPVTVQTPGGECRWQLELSEAGAERLTRLLEAAEERQPAELAPVLQLHRR